MDSFLQGPFLYILRIPCRRNKGPIKKKLKAFPLRLWGCALFSFLFFFCCSLRSHGWIEKKGTDSTVFRCYGGQSLSTHPRGTFINLYNRFLFIHQWMGWMGWMEVGERLLFYTIYMHLGGCESVAEYKFAAHCREPLIKKWHAWQAGASLRPPSPSLLSPQSEIMQNIRRFIAHYRGVFFGGCEGGIRTCLSKQKTVSRDQL